MQRVEAWNWISVALIERFQTHSALNIQNARRLLDNFWIFVSLSNRHRAIHLEQCHASVSDFLNEVIQYIEHCLKSCFKVHQCQSAARRLQLVHLSYSIPNTRVLLPFSAGVDPCPSPCTVRPTGCAKIISVARFFLFLHKTSAVLYNVSTDFGVNVYRDIFAYDFGNGITHVTVLVMA